MFKVHHIKTEQVLAFINTLQCARNFAFMTKEDNLFNLYFETEGTLSSDSSSLCHTVVVSEVTGRVTLWFE